MAIVDGTDEEAPPTIVRNAKLFEFSHRDPAKIPPIPFTIRFTEVDEDKQPTDKVEDIDFHVMGTLNAAGQLAIAGLMQGDEAGQVRFNSAGMYRFYQLVMLPAEYATFTATLSRVDLQITMEQLGEVTSWLIEEYGERPTQPSTGSSSTGSRTGRRSTANRSPRAKTSRS